MKVPSWALPPQLAAALPLFADAMQSGERQESVQWNGNVDWKRLFERNATEVLSYFRMRLLRNTGSEITAREISPELLARLSPPPGTIMAMVVQRSRAERTPVTELRSGDLTYVVVIPAGQTRTVQLQRLHLS